MKMDFEEVWGEKPAGGFVSISVSQLLSVWWFYEMKDITFYAFRVWLALQELPARRCSMGSDAKPIYRISELMTLTGQKRRSVVKKAIAELEACGLVQCRRSCIDFPKLSKKLEGNAQFQARLSLIRNNRRKVPFPRKMLRYLAAGSRATTVATVFGHLLRLLYHRKKRCRADGCCKASWIAAVFSLDVASIKRGRAALIRLGFLQRQAVPDWYQNKYGWRGYVNLLWRAVDKKGAVEERCCVKLRPQKRNLQETATPKTKQISPYGSNKPSSGKACSGDRKRLLFDQKLELADLRDDTKLEEVFGRAVAQGWIAPADRLNVFSAAEKAIRIARGVRNPVGVFVSLIRRRKWDYIPQCDEDSAQMRLGPKPRAAPCNDRGAGSSTGITQTSACEQIDTSMTSISEVLPEVMKTGFQSEIPASVRNRYEFSKGADRGCQKAHSKSELKASV